VRGIEKENYETLPPSKTSTSEAIEDSKPSNKHNKTLEKGKNYVRTFVRSNCIGYLQSINKEKTKIIKLLEIEENTDDDDEDVVFEIVQEFQYLGAMLSIKNDWNKNNKG